MGILLVALWLLPGACARHADLSESRPSLFWPRPPEVKRIQFLAAVSKPADLGIHPGMLRRFFNYMAGKKIPPMVTPYGISRDSHGRLYVVDTFLRQVHVFDAAGNRYFSFPKDRDQLVSPVGIAIDGQDRIFITDSKKCVVDVFKDHGKTFLSAFGQGLFKRPTGIAIDAKTSELLVVDTLDARVFRFGLADLSPRGSFGEDGVSTGQFHYPTNIATTADGTIIVSDALNFRVQVFSAGGRFLFTFGHMGDVPGSFSRPKGVAADSDGNIYVVDGLFDNIQIFNRKGRLLMAFGDHGSHLGEFWLPTGIYIDGNDTIYVADSSNHRVQIFRYLKEDKTK